ncbi:MAG: IS3 family transposase [Oscillospiraceae bacterium]|nr:IS3 family transposase [Oscillospiraceae bacterium]MDY4700185.1 IS3 family transposase [Oscillospiraceae bacterium]MDY5311505.1 IS3 family transposase [Oscillospiraceae bacterium]MDY5581924.1 IS3 family transposase [Oscillospiraceae bacterium]
MLKKTRCLSSEKVAQGKEKAAIVNELRQEYPLNDLLQLSGLARSTFYYYLKHLNTDKYECEKQEIQEIYNANKGRYGYRRITIAMRNKGYVINHKTVQKLMKQLSLKGKQRKNDKYHSYKGTVGKVADNLLKRDFYAEKPFEKITTDVTQFNVCDEKVYLSPVLDLFNNEVVSYSISTSPNLEQVREMLNGLFEKLPADATPIFHSDQGWQYQHAEYQRLLAEHNITQSMSRKGNCMDNGAMENFFGRLKVEMFYGEKFESVNAFIDELKKYIHYYNNERISLKLKGMSPVQYRTHSLTI